MHTSPTSMCSRIAPGEMVRLYHEAGYTTVFISNHWDRYHYDHMPEEMSFREKNDAYYAAYEEARAVGERYGMHVLFSPELTLIHNDYLLYGADRAFLDLREDVFDMSVAEFRGHALKHGVSMVQAHPFRDDICSPTPDYVDGFEVVNASLRHDNKDELVRAMAMERGLSMTAGSDAHRLEDVARAAMVSEVPIVSAEQYMDLLKRGELRLMLLGEIL